MATRTQNPYPQKYVDLDFDAEDLSATTHRANTTTTSTTMAGPWQDTNHDEQSLNMSVHTSTIESTDFPTAATETPKKCNTTTPPTAKRSSILDRMRVFEENIRKNNNNSASTFPTSAGSSFRSMEDPQQQYASSMTATNISPMQSPDVFRKIVRAAGTSPILSPNLMGKPSFASANKKNHNKNKPGSSKQSSFSSSDNGGGSYCLHLSDDDIDDDDDDDDSIKIMDACARLSLPHYEAPDNRGSSKLGSLVEIARVFEPTITEDSFRMLDSSMRSLDKEDHLRKILDYSRAEPSTPGCSFADNSMLVSLGPTKTPYHYVSPTLTVPRRNSLVAAIKEGMLEEDLMDWGNPDDEEDGESLPPFGEPVVLRRASVGMTIDNKKPNVPPHQDETRRSPFGEPVTLKKRGVSPWSDFSDDDVEVAKQTRHPFGQAVQLKKTAGSVPIFGQNPAPQRTQRDETIFNIVCAPPLTIDPETFQAPCYPKTDAQRALLHDAIKHTFVLSENQESTERSLIEAMEQVHIPHGEILARQGDLSKADDHFYVVEQGRVEFEVDGVTVGSALPGTSFGQERLLMRGPNRATVKASTQDDVRLFRLDQMVFRSIMIQHHQLPEAAIRAQKAAQEQKQKQEQAKEDEQPREQEEQVVDVEEQLAEKDDEEEAMQFVQELALKDSMAFQRQRTIRQSIQANVAFEDLEKISILGEGQFGEVWLVAVNVPGMEEEQIEERQEFALKIQNKYDEIRNNAEAAIRKEIEVLQQIHHPFIVNLVNVYESETSIDMLMGLITGGELWDVIHKEGNDGEWNSGIPESHAKFYSWLVTDTLSYIHSRQFVFRDLKPENIMLDEDGYPVLVDFGFAKQLPRDEMTFTFCGTPNYVAPELIKSMGHNAGVDYWALGVLIYEMIAGENPFYFDGMEQLALFQAIAEETYYALPEDKTASVLASDLLDRLLEKDSTQRLGMLQGGAQDILNHSWFDGLDAAKLRNKEVKAPWIPGQEEPANPGYEIVCNDDDSTNIIEEDDFEEEVIEEVIVEEDQSSLVEEAKQKKDAKLAKEGWTKVVATPRMNPAPTKDNPSSPRPAVEFKPQVVTELPRENETPVVDEKKGYITGNDSTRSLSPHQDTSARKEDEKVSSCGSPASKSPFSVRVSKVYRRESADYDGFFKHRKSPEDKRSSKVRRELVSEALRAFMDDDPLF
jgi:protein kinase A